ncbi:hypothetical protein AAMO2058_001318100 [Amorphochlora amoebiformis]|mmetsp:Transcript_9150/g.14481  ORF Transcript_9150/g.14481 Transcript_9150/m.14481 type:complete len:98 (+) Transcript_9150:61-354(+)
MTRQCVSMLLVAIMLFMAGALDVKCKDNNCKCDGTTNKTGCEAGIPEDVSVQKSINDDQSFWYFEVGMTLVLAVSVYIATRRKRFLKALKENRMSRL